MDFIMPSWESGARAGAVFAGQMMRAHAAKPHRALAVLRNILHSEDGDSDFKLGIRLIYEQAAAAESSETMRARWLLTFAPKGVFVARDGSTLRMAITTESGIVAFAEVPDVDQMSPSALADRVADIAKSVRREPPPAADEANA